MMSMQAGVLLGSKLVGSFISCIRPSEEVSFSISLPSAFVSPPCRQNLEWPLTSPVKNTAFVYYHGAFRGYLERSRIEVPLE